MSVTTACVLLWSVLAGSELQPAGDGAGSAAGPGQGVAAVIADRAAPLPLSAVRLTGGPLRHAQDLNANYLLSLQPDRMLAYYRRRAGLEEKARPYGGWDGDGKNLTGHVAGHYLSAISLMWAATGDPQFKERVDYLVRELQEVQDQYGDGYLGALADGRAVFQAVAAGDIRSSGFDLNGLWAPWYVYHKMFAGLRDAYRLAGNATALELEIRFAGWAESVLANLSDAQVQRMLNTEFGGMNEVLVDLYADTGDPRWLALSYRFEHHSFLDPLKRHQDNLSGKHGNTQVPKLIGSLARFAQVGDPGDGFAAGFFWDRVVQHHSYATGGHGKDEYFGDPDRLNDRIDGRTAETCNVYNMLKLTRRLFSLRPDAHYAEFHERALFNHILASIDPEDGRTCYMVPVGRGVQHEYQDMHRHFTCCVGSGMESHALHGDGIYYASQDTLWVNLFAPSTARWDAQAVQLTTDTDFPEGETATIHLHTAAPTPFTLAVRRPAWAGDRFAVAVNGEPVADLPPAGSHVHLRRIWQDGDCVSVILPKILRLEPLADNAQRAAILWGPLVLAGDLDALPSDETSYGPSRAPVLVAAHLPIEDWLKPVPDAPGQFRTQGVGRAHDVTLSPFYQLHRRTYAVYWDLFTPAQWDERAAELAAEQLRQEQLEAATVAFVQPGEMQPERDFNQQGEDTSADRVLGRPARRGRQWFSFDVPVDPSHPMTLVVTYYSDEWRRRSFDILVDNRRVGQQIVEKGGPPRFFDVHYPVPAELVDNKTHVTVRFEATQGAEIAAVFGLRMIRADAQ